MDGGVNENWNQFEISSARPWNDHIVIALIEKLHSKIE